MKNKVFTHKRGTLILHIKVIPNAGRNQVAGIRNGELLVRLKAQAEKGKANKELIKFLSGIVDIRKSDISIISGEKSQHKTLSLPENSDKAVESIL